MSLRLRLRASLFVLLLSGTVFAFPGQAEPLYESEPIIVPDPLDKVQPPCPVGNLIPAGESPPRLRTLDETVEGLDPFGYAGRHCPIEREEPQHANDPEPCGACEPPGRPAPPLPRLGLEAGRAFEAVRHAPPPAVEAGLHDWDRDGIPDILDAVNLPHEARLAALPDDRLLLPHGWDADSLLLLVEPSHRQAHLLLPLRAPGAGQDASLGGAAALGQVQSLFGTALRNQLAALVHEGMTVHVRWLPARAQAPSLPVEPPVEQADLSIEVPLAWDGLVAADGTWLLLHTDPTRLLELSLAGRAMNLVGRAVSHFTPGTLQLRYQFLNPHDEESFCYDSSTAARATSCRGKAEPGWVRAYSGQARYALEAAWTGLDGGVLPLSLPLPTPLETIVVPSTPALPSPPVMPPVPPPPTVPPVQPPPLPCETGCPLPTCTPQFCPTPQCIDQLKPACDLAKCPAAPTLCDHTLTTPDLSSLLDQEDAMDIFGPDAPWRLLGNRSHPFPVGVGIDYILDAEQGRPQQPHVLQVAAAALDGDALAQPVAAPRRFLFQGAFFATPALPRDLTHVTLGITDADGDASGQAFLLDGRRLAQLLDVRRGEALGVDIDEAHRAGFRSVVRDGNGDGVLDLLVHVPHFSRVWMSIYNRETYVNFWDVKLSSPTQGWLTGALGAVHRYASGQLEHYPIPGTTDRQRTYGLHMVSPSEFYVVGSGDCTTNTRGFLAHYRSPSLSQNGWVSVEPVGDCQMLYDVWMNPAQTFGYIGGEAGSWLGFSNGRWGPSPTRPPTGCSYTDLEFDASNNGQGFLGVITGEGTPCPGASAVLRFNGAEFFTASEANVGAVYDVASPNGGWAAGFQPWDDPAQPSYRWGTGASHQGGTVVFKQMPSAPPRNYFGVDGTDVSTWFVGSGGTGCCSGAIDELRNGAWTSHSLPYDSFLNRVDLWDRDAGLAVGNDVVLQFFDDGEPPVVKSVITPESGTVNTVFQLSDGGSSDPEGGPLTHRWWAIPGGTVDGPTGQLMFLAEGTGDIVHEVVDQDGRGAWDSRRFQVGMEQLNLGSLLSASLGPASRHQYRLAGDATDRYVQLRMTGPSSLQLKANVGAALMGAGSWPETGAQASDNGGGAILEGLLPAQEPLYVVVEGPSASYTLLASLVSGPATPSASVPSSIARAVPLTLTVQASHPSARPVRATVTWGDGASEDFPSSGFATSPAQLAATHTYPTRGASTITIRSFDDLGQASALATYTVVVKDPPAFRTLGYTDPHITDATLRGEVTDLGGSSWTQAWYVAYRDSVQVGRSPTYSFSAPDRLPNWVLSGLTPGTSYKYVVEADNGLGVKRTAFSNFETPPNNAVPPLIVTSPGSIPIGQTSSMAFKASADPGNDFAFNVRWGDGTESRHPAVGYRLRSTWNTAISAQHKYGFTGSYPVEVRLEDSTFASSAKATRTATITGGSPQAGLEATDPTVSTLVLRAVVGPIAYSTGTDLRLLVDGGAIESPWFTNVQTGQAVQWTTPGLSLSWHSAKLEFRSPAGPWTTPDAAAIQFRLNQPPAVGFSVTPLEATYLDTVRVTATYDDADGDPPMDGNGNPAPPQLTVGGSTYAMHPSGPGLYTWDFQPGQLAAGQAHAFEVRAGDRLHPGHAVAGGGDGWYLVQRSGVVASTFDDDAVGDRHPSGFTGTASELNLWHVTDTNEADMPGRVAMGNHGKAAWFGHEERGTYADPRGGVPFGELVSPVYDLRVVANPSLSFSSYYETESLTGEDPTLGGTCDPGESCCAPGEYCRKDLKQVLLRSKRPWEAEFGPWTLLRTVEGLEGGYKAWRTQHIGLSGQRDRLVQVAFRFDAVDRDHNNHLGWMVDDVAIGHDADGDKLPDDLERARWDMAVQSPLMPVSFQSQTGVLPIRGLERTGIESLVVRALVRHPDPDNVVVEFGWMDPQDQRTFVRSPLFANGADQTSCQTAPWEHALFSNGPSRPAVQRVPGGLDILLDLTGCSTADLPAVLAALDSGFVFFLAARDVSGAGAQKGTIESTTLYASGRTSLGDPDGDGDGAADGSELDKRTDPAGSDRDGDGAHQSVDADDTVPQWLPAVDIVSDDYGKGLSLTFSDAREPIHGVRFRMLDGGGEPTGGDLPWTYAAPNEYKVAYPQQLQQPFGLSIQWEARKDEVTVLNYTFEVVGNGHHPVELEVHDSSPRHTSGFEYIINRDHPTQGYGLKHCVMDYLLPEPHWKKLLDAGIQKVFVAGFKWIAPKVVPIANVVLLAKWAHDSPAAVACVHPVVPGSPWNVVGHGTDKNTVLTYNDDSLEEFADNGLTEPELRSVIQAGSKARFKDGFYHRRWVQGREVASTQGATEYHLAVLGVVSGWDNFIRDAWEWTLPDNPGATGTWSVEDALAVERNLYARMPQLGVGVDFPSQSIFANFASPRDCDGTSPFGLPLKVLRVNLRTEGTPVGSPLEVLVEPCVLSALTAYLSHNKGLNEWGVFQDRVDSVLSEIVLRAAQRQAALGDSPSQLDWYWGSPSACTSAPFLRRCDTDADRPFWSDWGTHHGLVDYGHYLEPVYVPHYHQEGTFSPDGKLSALLQLDNYLSTRAKDWSNAQADNLDLVAAEARVAARQVDGGDFQGQSGKAWHEAAASRMDARLANLPHQGMDASVRIVTDLCAQRLQCDLDPEAWIDFRGYP